MSKRNPEYDFVWCPGCGDFGVRRALEWALERHVAEHEIPQSNYVIVAGIGCSGNMVHLMEGDQPFGLHGIHGRTLPLSFGVKMGRPDIETVVVAGDGDFLAIGGEHIGPAAARNVDITCVVMDNGVYGLTKGQSSPTTEMGATTSSTPYGKVETQMMPLKYYMTIGVSYIASHYSSKPRDLANCIQDAMNHKVSRSCTSSLHARRTTTRTTSSKGIAARAFRALLGKSLRTMIRQVGNRQRICWIDQEFRWG